MVKYLVPQILVMLSLPVETSIFHRVQEVGYGFWV